MVGALLCGCYTGIEHPLGDDVGTDTDAAADSASDDAPGRAPSDDTAELDRIAELGLRRLTIAEYERTLRDLLGDEAGAGGALPEDSRNPFDNDYTAQAPTKTLIEMAELAARGVAERLLADRPRFEAVVGCDAAELGSAACFRGFVERFGRRAFRRTLTDSEADRFAATFDGDFDQAVETAVSAFLQDPRFLYRIEVGTQVPDAEGLFVLSGTEVASRLSYLLWGTMPTDALLDDAEAGMLDDPEGVRAAAEAMLVDPRAQGQLARYHAMWLGYDLLNHEFSEEMLVESDALVIRTVLEDRDPWFDLFTAEETFVGHELAALYGLASPGSEEPRWVGYGDSGRAGILSHGAFLALGVSDMSTTPTARGKEIRQRLFCQEIELPTGAVAMMADVDAEPPEDACQREWYESVHAVGGACESCHVQMDPIGFGLANYNYFGEYQDTEPGKPHCTISGDGKFVPLGDFNGPAELGELLVASDAFDACAVRTLYQYVVGRSELDERDEAFVDELVADGEGADALLTDRLLRIVGDPSFGFRRVPQG